MGSVIAKINSFREWYHSPAAENSRHRLKREAQALFMVFFRLLILLGIGYIIVSPLIGILSNTFKDVSDVYNPLVYLIPERPNLQNIRIAAMLLDYFPALMASMVFVLGISLLQVLITSMVGYGFARFRIPLREVLFAIVILTIVVPINTYTTSLYMQFRYFKIFGMQFNLINTYVPILLLTGTGMGLRSGLYVYIFRQFFRGLPKEIEEAALIDGAGQFRTYYGVMMPNAIPAILTVLMFSVVWQYNDTLYTSMFMRNLQLLSSKLAGLPIAYAASRETSGDPNATMLVTNAAITLIVAPVLAVYVFVQRYFMEGIERSGIVG